MNENEIALRKEAIQLFLSGETKAGIARQLSRSRAWVQRWTERYQPDHADESLRDHSHRPEHLRQAWSEEVRQMVLNSRRLRQAGEQPGYRYALTGAEAIHYELKELGITPVPPVRTIHTWLKQAGMIPERPEPPEKEHVSKPYPAPANQEVNDLHELDLKGPFYLTGSPQKYYLCALRDVASKQVVLAVICDKRMETIMDFLLAAWRKLGLPKILQMDNGLEFRGSNRHPRAFGKLIWMCQDLGVEPLFIPPHEPWRNGVIENLNGLLDRLLLARQTFSDLDHLQSCAQELEQVINTQHRLPALDGKTPAEFAQGVALTPLPDVYDWRSRNLRLVKGKVSFVRLVRKSGRFTLCARDKFELGSEYQWQYVYATIDVAAHRLDVFWQGEMIRSFDFG